MAPITWKNINAPDLQGANIGMAIAGRTMDGAFDSVSGLLDKYRKVDNANWDNQANINTEDAVARLRGLAGMNDFNAQEANFDPTALRADFGRQIHNDQVQAELLKRKGVLTNEAIGQASSAGLGAADDTKSAATAVNIFRQQLIESGIKDPNVINAKTAEFAQHTMAPMKDAWTQQGDQAVIQGVAQTLSQGAPQPGQPAQQGQPGQPALAVPEGVDKFAHLDRFVAGVEGGYSPSDGKSKAPVNFGINQAANPDVDVKKLTPEGAQDIRKTRYWDKVKGIDQMDPQAALVAYDAAINQGVGYANKLVTDTGGDISKMMEKRTADYQALALKDPEHAKNLPGWMHRMRELNAQLTPEQRTGQLLTQMQQANPNMTLAQVNTLKDANATVRTGRDSDLTNQSKQVGLESSQLNLSENKRKIQEEAATRSIVQQMHEAAAQGGPAAAANIGKGHPMYDNALEIFKKQDVARTELTPEEQGKVTLQEAENTQLKDAAVRIFDQNINDLSRDIGIADPFGTEGYKKIQQAVEAHPEGLAGYISDPATPPGVFTNTFSRNEYGNALKDSVVKIKGRLTSEGIPSMMADKIVLEAFKQSGGLREGVFNKEGLNYGKLVEALPAAAALVQKLGALEGKKSAEENKKLAFQDNLKKQEAYAVEEKLRQLKEQKRKGQPVTEVPRLKKLKEDLNVELKVLQKEREKVGNSSNIMGTLDPDILNKVAQSVLRLQVIPEENHRMVTGGI